MTAEQELDWMSAVIASGIHFLRRNLGIDADGLWRDFTAPGISAGSTEWVSAFIAAQIGVVPEAKSLSTAVVRTIASRSRTTGGWGYREDVPEDCDSTAWVLLAAMSAGVELPPAMIDRSRRFMLEHQLDNGGFVTFGDSAKKLIGTPNRSGWFEAELSVTCAAVLALELIGLSDATLLSPACSYILRNCHMNLWQSYWWNGFAYATYCALLALSHQRQDRVWQLSAGWRAAILQGRGAEGGWPNQPASPANEFSTSFAIRALLILDPTSGILDLATESLRFLAGSFSEVGGFSPSAEMLAPGGVNDSNLVLRDNGLVTTACAVRAFHEVRNRFMAET